MVVMDPGGCFGAAGEDGALLGLVDHGRVLQRCGMGFFGFFQAGCLCLGVGFVFEALFLDISGPEGFEVRFAVHARLVGVLLGFVDTQFDGSGHILVRSGLILSFLLLFFPVKPFHYCAILVHRVVGP